MSRVVGWHGASLNSSNGGFNSSSASSSAAGGSGDEPLERMLARSLDVIVSNQESIMERLAALEDAVEDVLEYGTGGATSIPSSSNESAHAMRPGEGAVGAEKKSATVGISRTHWWSKRVRHHKDRRRSSIFREHGTGGGGAGGDAADGRAGGGTDGGGGAPLPHAVFDLPASS